MLDGVILDFVDQGGRVYRVYRWCLTSHLHHWQWREPDFSSWFREAIKDTILNPTGGIYQDYERPKKRLCFYRKEIVAGQFVGYTKVVVEVGRKEICVISAYQPPTIKELKYNHKPCNRP